MHRIPEGGSGGAQCVMNDAVLLNAPAPARLTALARTVYRIPGESPSHTNDLSRPLYISRIAPSNGTDPSPPIPVPSTTYSVTGYPP